MDGTGFSFIRIYTISLGVYRICYTQHVYDHLKCRPHEGVVRYRFAISKSVPSFIPFSMCTYTQGHHHIHIEHQQHSTFVAAIAATSTIISPIQNKYTVCGYLCVCVWVFGADDATYHINYYRPNFVRFSFVTVELKKKKACFFFGHDFGRLFSSNSRWWNMNGQWP